MNLNWGFLKLELENQFRGKSKNDGNDMDLNWGFL